MHNTPNIQPIDSQLADAGDTVDVPNLATWTLSAAQWENELDGLGTKLLDLAARCPCGDACSLCTPVFLIGSLTENHAKLAREVREAPAPTILSAKVSVKDLP